MTLPTDDKERKELPVFTGPLMYFPDAIAEIARVCKIGNDKHNPGEPMHWARDKSTDQLNTALRHMMDHGTGNVRDKDDGCYHIAKAAWRLLAELQLQIERDAVNTADCAVSKGTIKPESVPSHRTGVTDYGKHGDMFTMFVDAQRAPIADRVWTGIVHTKIQPDQRDPDGKTLIVGRDIVVGDRVRWIADASLPAAVTGTVESMGSMYMLVRWDGDERPQQIPIRGVLTKLKIVGHEENVK